MKKIQNKGITLIALVITIIVLLILAGVSLSMISGENGILTKSQEAKETHLEASEKEEIGLAVSDARIGEDGYQPLTQENLQAALDGIATGYDAEGIEESTDFKVTSPTGRVYTVSGDGKTISKTGEDLSPKYYVRYNKNGENVSGTIANTKIKGSSTTITNKTYTREGYEFDSWNTEADGTGTPVASGDTIETGESNHGTKARTKM